MGQNAAHTNTAPANNPKLKPGKRQQRTMNDRSKIKDRPILYSTVVDGKSIDQSNTPTALYNCADFSIEVHLISGFIQITNI